MEIDPRRAAARWASEEVASRSLGRCAALAVRQVGHSSLEASHRAVEAELTRIASKMITREAARRIEELHSLGGRVLALLELHRSRVLPARCAFESAMREAAASLDRARQQYLEDTVVAQRTFANALADIEEELLEEAAAHRWAELGVEMCRMLAS